jgi:hypothetical protein
MDDSDGTMSSIKNSLNGLTSSLLLSVGLTSVAEKFDSMRQNSAVDFKQAEASAEPCIYVCNFRPEAGE